MHRFPAVVATVALSLSACTGQSSETTVTSGVAPPGGESSTTTGLGSPVDRTTVVTILDPPGTDAMVERVVDGDSLLVLVEGEPDEIRLIGINAPEFDECGADEARITLGEAQLFESVTLVGDRRDQFGRRLAYLFAGGEDVGLGLVGGGRAIATSTDHPGRDDYITAEGQARAEGFGLWAPAACGRATNAAIEITFVRFDPPGPDGDDLGEEWLEIVNAGERAADLSGWTLRDESSANRYEFPEGSRIDPGFALVIATGCGEDAPQRLHWCADGPVWNNGGDMAMLLDEHGNVVSMRRYRG